jgi:hypothetical protein
LFDLGVDQLHEAVKKAGCKPAPDSLAWADSVTFTPHEPGHAATGHWWALLTLMGAAEMIRSFASLYAQSIDRPLTRGHLAVMRSIQEHLGRVIWLLEPGASVTSLGAAPATPTSDPFAERRLRNLLLHQEWMKDCASSAKLEQSPELAAFEAGLSEATTAVDTAKQVLQQPDAKIPSPTQFAELCMTVSAQLHGAAKIQPKAAYKRLSETAHGGLWGLLGDRTVGPDDLWRFEQNDADLDACASTVAAWWVTGVALLSAVYGWDADKVLGDFEATRMALYPPTATP